MRHVSGKNRSREYELQRPSPTLPSRNQLEGVRDLLGDIQREATEVVALQRMVGLSNELQTSQHAELRDLTWQACSVVLPVFCSLTGVL